MSKAKLRAYNLWDGMSMKRSEMRGGTGGGTVEEGVEGPAWPEDMVGQVTDRRRSGSPSTRFGQVIANSE
jgi:hypothetical protein